MPMDGHSCHLHPHPHVTLFSATTAKQGAARRAFLHNGYFKSNGKIMNQIIKTSQEGLQATSLQSANGRKLKNFIFPKGISPMKKKIIANVRTHDFHVVAIREENDTPQFFYTIGLYYQFQHPELLIMGLDVNVAHDILMRAHALIKSGGTIQPWTNLPIDMTHTPMRSVPIDASNYSSFLGFGMWFYRSLGGSRPDTFPAIQFIWPDVWNQIYPWEAGYDKGFFDAQTVLCSDQELKQAVERNAWGANGS